MTDESCPDTITISILDNLKVYLLIYNPGYEPTPVIGAFSSPEKLAEGRRKATTEPREGGIFRGERYFIDPYPDCDLEEEVVTLDEYLHRPTQP